MDSHATSSTVSTLVRNAESTSSLIAGAGLTGGGALNSSTSVTFDVGAGTGILVAADSIAVDPAYFAGLYQPLDADLTSWAAITRAAGFDTFVATPTSANLASLVTDENGSGKLIFAAGTLAITAAKTLTATNTLTLSGTDSTTHTFPATSSSVARIDAAQTFAGVQTFSAQDVHTLGIDLSTSGRINSQVADAPAAVSILLQPNVAQTPNTDRWTHAMKDSAGNTRFSIASNGAISLFSEGATNLGVVSVAGTAATTMTYGIFFAPTWAATSGGSIAGIADMYVAGYFVASDAAGTSATSNLVGGYFGNSSVSTSHAHAAIYGGIFKPAVNFTGTTARTTDAVYGWKVLASGSGKSQTVTNYYGGYVENHVALAGSQVTTNLYGLYVEEQTRGATINNGLFFANVTAGYKAIAIRDQNAWIGSAAAAELTIGGTNFRCASTNQGVFGVAAIARPTNAIAAAAFVANTSGIVDNTATWGGYTMGQVVQALQNYGVLT